MFERAFPGADTVDRAVRAVTGRARNPRHRTLIERNKAEAPDRWTITRIARRGAGNGAIP
jgi:hypothetical protein